MNFNPLSSIKMFIFLESKFYSKNTFATFYKFSIYLFNSCTDLANRRGAQGGGDQR